MKFNLFNRQEKSIQEEAKKEEKRPEAREEFKPIRACIIDSTKIDPQTQNIFSKIEMNGQFIDYYEGQGYYKENNIKNAGNLTYVISECNEKDKYSIEYHDCTGVIVVGEETDGNKQISFMSHQEPSLFLDSKKEKFVQHLIEGSKEIKNKVKEQSIDVVIFGGDKGDDIYKKSIKFLGDVLTKEFGIEPTIMTGPNSHFQSSTEDTRVYFDTQNRRLYIARPFQENNKVNENYFPTELDKKSKEW